MMDAKNEPEAVAPQENVEYSLSPNLYGRLAQLNVSVAFSSYQSGYLYFLGRGPGGPHLHRTGIGKPMGIFAEPGGGLCLATFAQIVRFENMLAPHERANEHFDALFAPRIVHQTGSLDAHDVGVDASDRPIFVNTRFNCLATPTRGASFAEVWKPPFITGLLDGDKCHVNGMAMAGGEAAYVTAVSRSDVIDGWRDRRGEGGVAIDVKRNEIVCEGLSMPHSPRVHKGELWVLNSGTGDLGIVDKAKGRFEPRVFCPGFVRGLAFHDDFAFVGLSKPRYKRFEGLALDERLRKADSEPWCGIQIIDLNTGGCVDWLRIDGDVAELYDVAVVPGVACPMALAPGSVEAANLVIPPKK